MSYACFFSLLHTYKYTGFLHHQWRAASAALALKARACATPLKESGLRVAAETSGELSNSPPPPLLPVWLLIVVRGCVSYYFWNETATVPLFQVQFALIRLHPRFIGKLERVSQYPGMLASRLHFAFESHSPNKRRGSYREASLSNLRKMCGFYCGVYRRTGRKKKHGIYIYLYTYIFVLYNSGNCGRESCVKPPLRNRGHTKCGRYHPCTSGLLWTYPAAILTPPKMHVAPSFPRKWSIP